MNPENPFKWRHFETEIILLCVRWYLRYPLSYRDLEEMMQERRLDVDHTTIYRWVQQYSPELEKKCRRYLKPTNDSYRVDETYIKIKGKWKYLYRAVDSRGNTIDFMLSSNRNKHAAKRFFKKAFKASHSSKPRVVNVDKNPAYSPAMDELKNEGILSEDCKLRQNKYLNNIVEQDHRFIKRVVNPGLGFSSFNTARRTLKGYEAMHMIRKGQVEEVRFSLEAIGEKFITIKEPDLSLFSESELKILATLKEHFNNFTSGKITDFSHDERGYKETQTGQTISYEYADKLQL